MLIPNVVINSFARCQGPSGDHQPIQIRSQFRRNSAVKYMGTTVLIVFVLFV